MADCAKNLEANTLNDLNGLNVLNWFVRVDYRQAAQARSSQPKRKATPPIGVMAPSQRIPVKLNLKRLQEKTTIRIMNAPPAVPALLSGQREIAQATASKARA